jgi:hypothetical protein
MIGYGCNTKIETSHGILLTGDGPQTVQAEVIEISTSGPVAETLNKFPAELL